MKNKLLLGAGAIGLAAAVLVSAPAANGAGTGSPSAKAAVAISELIALSQVSSPSTPTNDTGWVDVLETTIKTSSQKDLLFDVALQCGLVTDTTVKSSGGTLSQTTARANIAVRVLVDGVPAEPDHSIDATKTTAEGVVYCDRIQTLAAKFAGLNCTADATTGVVTCTDPEELRLLLRTLDAHSFNFAKVDVGTGVHAVVVQARAQTNNLTLDPSATFGGAEAFTGAGALVVEEVRLVKGADIVIDVP